MSKRVIQMSRQMKCIMSDVTLNLYHIKRILIALDYVQIYQKIFIYFRKYPKQIYNNYIFLQYSKTFYCNFLMYLLFVDFVSSLLSVQQQNIFKCFFFRKSYISKIFKNYENMFFFFAFV